PLQSGTYSPVNYRPAAELKSPAPPAPYGTNLSDFAGHVALGVWKLFAYNLAPIFGPGAMQEGWSLILETSGLVIIQQPTGGVVPLGSSTELSVTALGEGPFEYLWFLNGLPLPGQKSSSLQIANMTPEQAGSYTVLVFDVHGASVLSQPALVLLQP